MKHKYNIPNLLLSLLTHKGLPYPGGFFPPRPVGGFTGEDFDAEQLPAVQQELIKGTRLYKQDALGQWYFMPVVFKHPNLPGGELELPHAVISITGSKNIVETPLVGRKGSVKELISINDYKVSLAGFICSDDGSYPDAGIEQLRELYNINESVELVSVLTDLILDKGVRVVISDIDFPPTPGVEDGQAVTLECTTDEDFELNID